MNCQHFTQIRHHQLSTIFIIRSKCEALREQCMRFALTHVRITHTSAYTHTTQNLDIHSREYGISTYSSSLFSTFVCVYELLLLLTVAMYTQTFNSLFEHRLFLLNAPLIFALLLSTTFFSSFLSYIRSLSPLHETLHTSGCMLDVRFDSVDGARLFFSNRIFFSLYFRLTCA